MNLPLEKLTWRTLRPRNVSILMKLGGAHAIGPILLGMNKAFHVLQMGSSVREIVNMAAIAGIHARLLEKINNKK